MNFEHALGLKVKSNITGLTGVLISRSECLNGCNRYLVQPAVEKENKIPESWWVDEAEIMVLEGPKIEPANQDRGGPSSRHS